MSVYGVAWRRRSYPRHMPDHDRRWALLLLIPMLMSLSVGAGLRTAANAEGGAAEPRPVEAYASYRKFESRDYLASSCASRATCSKTLRHRDHMHISLSRAGGRGETSWYDGRLG